MAEEWKMILDALSAYQHNEAYRALYEKLLAELPPTYSRDRQG